MRRRCVRAGDKLLRGKSGGARAQVTAVGGRGASRKLARVLQGCRVTAGST